jgi:hypothetical protein
VGVHVRLRLEAEARHVQRLHVCVADASRNTWHLYDDGEVVWCAEYERGRADGEVREKKMIKKKEE